MERKRLIWADSLKGLLIILVVLGHSIQGTYGSDCENNHLWNIIYSFHMPAFMAVSGFLAFRPNGLGGGKLLGFGIPSFQAAVNSVCPVDFYYAVS